MRRILIVPLVVGLIFASLLLYAYLTRTKVQYTPPKIEMALVPGDNLTYMTFLSNTDFGREISLFFSDNTSRSYKLDMEAGRVYVILIDKKTEYGEEVLTLVFDECLIEVGKRYVFLPPLG